MLHKSATPSQSAMLAVQGSSLKKFPHFMLSFVG
jgi:hypothetical protein